MIVTYDVACFDRELQVKFPDGYKAWIGAIWNALDDAYYKWCCPEDIEDPEESKYVQDSCCEEFMMDELSLVFNQWEEWTSVYYGDDPAEMEYEVDWTKNNMKGEL